MKLLGLIVLLITFAEFAAGLGLDCDSVSHSCDSCIDFNCYWCQGPSNNNFCTSNPNLCVGGSLYEDSLFCPKSEPAFDSLEWWGENAFISRAVACTDFSYGCHPCVSQQSPLSCGWCAAATSPRCNVLSPSIARCPQLTGCVLDPAPADTIDEDTSITKDINPWFFVMTEVNSTETSTSSVMNVAVTRSGSGSFCTASLDTDSLTITPAANKFGTCAFQVAATAMAPTNGYKTRLVTKYTLTVTAINDPPAKRDDTFDNTVGPLSSLKQDQTITLEGCSMFQDFDGYDFDVTVTGDLAPSGYVSVIAPSSSMIRAPAPCACYSGSRKCPIIVTGVNPGDGNLVFQASDGTSSSDAITVPVSVQAVNHAPSCTPSTGFTFTIDENTLSNQVTFASPSIVCTDPDASDSLSYAISSEINQLAKDVNIDGTALNFNLDGVKNGQTTSRVTVTDGNGGSTSFPFMLVVTPVNDAVYVLDDTWSGRTFAGQVGTSQTFDLSSVVADEESTFATGTLKCVPSASSSDATKATVTISQNIGTIKFLQPANPGVTWTLTCSDNPLSGGGALVLNLIVQVDYTNHAPTVSTNFPALNGVPPPSGSVNLTPLSLSNYFKDQDVGQTLSYNFVVSNSSAVSAVITSNVLTVSLNAGASGYYQVNVTATDDDPNPLSVTQTLTVLAYVQPKCTSVVLPWNPTAPLVIDVTQYCVASGTLAVTFTESKTNNTLIGNVTTSVSGTKITFTAANSCIVGKYVGLATVTDNWGNWSTISIQLNTNNTASTISTQKSIYSYLVTSTSGSSFTGYDGNVQVQGGGTVRLNLIQVVKTCGDSGSLGFTLGTSTYSFNSTTQPRRLESELEGVNLVIEPNTPASILQAWTFSQNVTVTDKKSTNKSTFQLNVTKLYVG